jgi:hypothetical protein
MLYQLRLFKLKHEFLNISVDLLMISSRSPSNWKAVLLEEQMDVEQVRKLRADRLFLAKRGNI